MIGVLGDLLTDVVVRLNAGKTDIRYGTDTDAKITYRRGGSAANLAVAAAGLGAEVAFIGNVGEDSRGESLLAELSAEGVQTFVTRRGATGTVVAVVDLTGERSMLTDRGSAAELEDWEPIWLQNISLLHIPGYSLVVEPLGHTAIEMAKALKSDMPEKPNNAIASSAASKAGETENAGGTKNASGAKNALISVGISSVGAVKDYGVDKFWQQVAAANPDLVICNQEEADLLGERLYDYMAVVSAGAEPTRIYYEGRGEALEVCPPALDSVADTTGAGDAFSAGLLVGLSRGEPVQKAVELGHKSAEELLRSHL